MVEWFLLNWDLVLSACSLVTAIVTAIVYYVKRFRTLRSVKTQSEKDAIIAELKSHTYGLVAVAEQMFADIPKSGSSKLLYVLNHLRALCGDKGVEFNENTWKEFIESIVGKSNDVITAKETERAISGYIAKVKEEIPYFIADADKLFELIPDSAPYKIEYILKLVSNSCAKHAVNVYDLYDWRGYVENAYNERIA